MLDQISKNPDLTLGCTTSDLSDIDVVLPHLFATS